MRGGDVVGACGIVRALLIRRVAAPPAERRGESGAHLELVNGLLVLVGFGYVLILAELMQPVAGLLRRVLAPGGCTTE